MRTKNVQIIAAASLIVAAAIIKRQNKIKRKRLWSRKWLLQRNVGRGAASFVLKELRVEDEKSFKNFTRMSFNTFNNLLRKVGPFIKRQDTHLRESIPACTR